MSRQLRPYQRAAVAAVQKAWAEGQLRPAVVMATGLGKALPDTAEIPIPGGFTTMGELHPGSYVFAEDGHPTKVTGVYPQGLRQTYLVKFDDGAEVLADGEHLWAVANRGRTRAVMTTAQLAAAPKKNDNGYVWRVPVMAAAQQPARGLPLAPYTTGALLANGYVVQSRAPQLTTPDLHVIERVRADGYTVVSADHGAGLQWRLPGLSHAITRSGIRGQLSKEKFIPTAYLCAAEGDRVALLQGLMDGDGSSRAGGRRSVNYHSCSKRLANDVVSLVWSLGGRASINHYVRSDSKPDEYLVCILMPSDIEAFSTPRKARNQAPRRIFQPRRAIVDVVLAGVENCTCITVAHPKQTFAAGRRYVITHNSTVIARLAADHVGHPDGVVNGKPERRGRRVLILAHRHELLEQLKDNVLAIDPEVTVGIVKAERNETGPDVVIGSIQTLANPARLEQIKDVGLVVVDECHHSVARTYMETLAQLGCFSDTIAVGVTATMDRSDQKMLADVWESVAYSKGIREGIAEGHLVRPIGKAVVLESLDLSQVKTSKGDFQEGQLGEAVEDASVDIAKAVVNHAKDRRRILVFVPTVASAIRLSVDLDACDLPSEVVVGTTDKLKRSFIYQSLRDGDIRVIVSVGVLTEGFDLPAIDCIVMARPTQSASLYQQCIGRGLRPSPDTGKTDCLVLDVCDVNRIHTLHTLDKLVPDSPYARVGRDDDELPQELAEAIEASEPVGKIELEGTVIDRDLFGDSEALWLRTHRGARFIPAGDWLIFLWEENDLFRVGQLAVKGPALGGWLADGGLYTDEKLASSWADLTVAKAIAERHAHELDPSLSKRAAPWRKGTRAPSEAQVRYARGLGIRNPETKSKSRLSDDISQTLASYRLDV